MAAEIWNTSTLFQSSFFFHILSSAAPPPQDPPPGRVRAVDRHFTARNRYLPFTFTFSLSAYFKLSTRVKSDLDIKVRSLTLSIRTV